MKRFHFELQQVLKYKQRLEQLAEIKQGQAAAAVQAAQMEVAALNEQLQQTCLRLQEKLGKPQDATTWMAIYAQSTRLQQALQIAGQKVERANRELDLAATARKQATIEVETLLTLRRQKWQQHCTDHQHAAQEHSDEVSLRRWLANHKVRDEGPRARGEGGGE